ncbi:unnamed protein product [Phaeothamnion confervicola]
MLRVANYSSSLLKRPPSESFSFLSLAWFTRDADFYRSASCTLCVNLPVEGDLQLKCVTRSWCPNSWCRRQNPHPVPGGLRECTFSCSLSWSANFRLHKSQ